MESEEDEDREKEMRGGGGDRGRYRRAKYRNRQQTKWAALGGKKSTEGSTLLAKHEERRLKSERKQTWKFLSLFWGGNETTGGENTFGGGESQKKGKEPEKYQPRGGCEPGSRGRQGGKKS